MVLADNSYRIVRCLAVVSLWVLFAGSPARADDWPTYQHDVCRSGSTDERIEARGLSLQWTWRSPHPPRPAWAGPAKWDAYAQRRGLPPMRAYDLSFSPIAVGDFVFFGSSADDSVYCLDADSGREKWSFAANGPIRVALSFANGKLYFGSDDGYAYCLKADDGSLIWRFRPTEPGRLILNNGRLVPLHPCRTGVLVDGGTAYFGNALLPWKNAYLCAVDAATGRPEGPGRYVRELAGLTLEGPPAATSQWLVFPQGRVAPRVFQRSDGNDQGSLKKSSGGSIVVAASDSTVFHGPGADSRKGAIKSSNMTTREVIAGAGRGNALVVCGTLAYMLTDDTLVASDLTSRKQLWTVPCEYPHALISAGDMLFAGGDDQVVALSAKDGKPLWRHAVEGKALSLAAANGRLLVGTDDGVIHLFQAPATGDSTESRPSAASAATPTDPLNQTELAEITTINDKNLLGRWVFQQPHVSGKTVKDLTGKADGTMLGKTRLRTAGKHQALEFDGSSQSVLMAADHTKVALPERTITAEAWVRVDKPLTWGGIVGAVQDNGAYERGWILGYRESKLCFAVAGKEGNGRLTYLTAKTDFDKERWYHLAGTYDGATMRLYVNGRLENTSTVQKGDIDYPPKAFYEIGAYHDKDENFRLSGMIHEVCVYKAVLSAEQIAERFTAKSPRFPPPPPANTFRLAAGPWLQFTEPGVAIARWRTRLPSPSRLEYWSDGPPVKVEDATPKTEHEVCLSGLRYNRVYSYVIQARTDGGTESTRPFECDTFFNYCLPLATGAADSAPTDESSLAAEAAERILALTGVKHGICLVIGSGEGRLAHELARRSSLRVIGVETDPKKVEASRQALRAAGLYGARVAVHKVERLDQLPLLGHFANLVVSDVLLGEGQCPSSAAEVLRVLRPDGGVACLGQPGGAKPAVTAKQLQSWLEAGPVQGQVTDDAKGVWARVVRKALPGAGEWTHLYGRANNSGFGGEELGGAKAASDLRVQWVGRPGPRCQADRNGRKPSPLSTGGRLFLQGLHRIVALDAFNGSISWSLEIPQLERFNVPRDCSNWCADREFIYAAVADKCWKIDTSLGKVASLYGVIPGPIKGWEYDWGYVARVGDGILGTAVKRGTSWTNFWGGGSEGWYDALSGAVTDKVCSDNLFALDKETGKAAWTYSGGVILNSTITADKDRVFFVECRHPKVKQAPERRVGAAELWQDQHLVALNAQTGALLWEEPIDTADGTVVFYMAHGKGRLVIVSSTDAKYHVYGFTDDAGQPVWSQSFGWLGGKGDHGKAMSRPAIVGGRVYVRPQAFSLADGTPSSPNMPGGGCGTYACAANALIFRGSGTVTLWDRNTGKSSTWSRLRPDCWLSTIPASGMLLSPEGGGGCSCGNWLETSIGFVPISQP